MLVEISFVGVGVGVGVGVWVFFAPFFGGSFSGGNFFISNDKSVTFLICLYGVKLLNKSFSLNLLN